MDWIADKMCRLIDSELLSTVSFIGCIFVAVAFFVADASGIPKWIALACWAYIYAFASLFSLFAILIVAVFAFAAIRGILRAAGLIDKSNRM